MPTISLSRVLKDRGVAVSACHQNRFNVAVQETSQGAIEAGRFGKISHGSIHVRWNSEQGILRSGVSGGARGNRMAACLHEPVHPRHRPFRAG